MQEADGILLTASSLVGRWVLHTSGPVSTAPLLPLYIHGSSWDERACTRFPVTPNPQGSLFPFRGKKKDPN